MNSPFTPDTDYSGGSAGGTGAPITVAGVANAAPIIVYQNCRLGNCVYTVPTIPRSHLHRATPLRGALLHPGRATLFNVLINGVQVLTNFDIFAAAGAAISSSGGNLHHAADINGNVTIVLEQWQITPRSSVGSRCW